MHTQGSRITNGAGRARAANLIGAFALEVAGAQERATTAAMGQSGAAAAALATVAVAPGRTVEQLRGALGLTQPGAARLFERLASEGYLERGGPGGRKGFSITLTPVGHQKVADILAARQAVLLDVLAAVGDAELDRLTAVLERILAARTTDRPALERICRLCERNACEQCPVGHAMDLLIESGQAD